MSQELRDQVVHITHVNVYAIKFFHNRSEEFLSRIIYELKPISLGVNEVLYEQGDELDQIYFISHGKVKLYIDMLKYVQDNRLKDKLIDFEK